VYHNQFGDTSLDTSFVEGGYAILWQLLSMMAARWQRLFVIGMLGVMPTVTWADVVRLYNGREIEGVIQRESETALWIDVDEGLMVVQKDQVRHIERGKTTQISVDRAKRLAWERGQAALQAGATAEALAAFQEALRNDPNDPHLYNNLGLCFATLYRDEEAISMFRQALDLEASHTSARRNLARMRFAHDQLSEAITLLLPLTERSNDPMVWQQLGFLYYLAGDRATALSAYEQARQAAPEDIALLYDLGCLYALNGQLDQAMGLMRRIIALDDRAAFAYDALGQLYDRRGFHTLAKESYYLAHSLDPVQPRYLHHLARALIRSQEFTHAGQVVKRLLLVDPPGTEAQSYEAMIAQQERAPDPVALPVILELEPRFEAPIQDLDTLEVIKPPLPPRHSP